MQRKVGKRTWNASRSNLRGALWQVGTQFSLNLVDARQAGLQRLRHLAHELILGHAHRFGDAAQRIFRYKPVFLLAQQQADGRLIFRRLDLRVERGQVEPAYSGLNGVVFSSTTT